MLTSTRGEGRTNRGSEYVATAELGPDKIAVFAKSLAQRGHLNLQILLRDNDAWPHAAYELFFGDQRSFGLQQDQEEIEGACPQLYWHAVGHQLPAAQQDAETAEFEHRVGCCRARPVGPLQRRVLAVEGELGAVTRCHRGPSVGFQPAIWRGPVPWSR